ncbi:pirin family protein [Pedobacter sp. L105]|uniref:pirin family protein n=1 Tax=Pedobacter sp. L105 TaxID=1641871 RepID=UPI00131CC793|nr:pirin family protein [Pedobacter sp. L105]
METCVKSVSAVLDAPLPNRVGNGFRVNNFFPRGYKICMSPFFMLDFNARTEIKGANEPRGVGVHPHRGFETVTIAYHGVIAHHDSAGNSGVIYPGDVQWMTAARGILHKEYFEQRFNETGGVFQMVQLWVNLPAKDKMSPPKYQAVKQADLKKYDLPANGGTIEIIAGDYAGVSGSVSTFTALQVYNARLLKEGEVVFNFPAHFNTGFLVVEGKVTINGSQAAIENQFVYFKNDGEQISVKASQNSVVLVLSGEPIDEPIAQYGPFLMNNQEELQQAISDYNEGRFGYLDEE